ncbi:uncharacterized protein LOC120358221 [Solenopsis invicta]|uniref:uncharacterized protein LOC120358221 n=1 Tax=Solenopsis invicta TaxID=13686 RepID=UPI00193DD9E3|nr:uncharacterized protein LOC120358221 [Solenopsis invicta]
MNVDWLRCVTCCLISEPPTDEVIAIRFTLLELAPKLGQRVHFAEGTNLRCREDTVPSEIRSHAERARYGCNSARISRECGNLTQRCFSGLIFEETSERKRSVR